MKQSHSNRGLDDLDLSLIEELDKDPRQSCLQLAAKLPASRTTVRRRLQRLLDENIIRLVTMTSPVALGYQTQATIAMTAHPGSADAVADQLVSLPNVRHLAMTTGRYDLMVFAIFPDLEDMLAFMDEELGGIPYLRSAEALVGVGWNSFYLNPLTRTSYSFAPVPRHHALDELDVAIIRELETDTAQSNLDLAKKLDVSRPTLRKRIQSLLDDHVIRVAALVNPSVLGYDVLAILLVKARPGEISSVAKRLTSLMEIGNLIITAGSYDMIAYGTFRDPSHMSEFMREQAGRIRGVIRIETMIVLSRRVSFSLLTLGLPPARQSLVTSRDSVP